MTASQYAGKMRAARAAAKLETVLPSVDIRITKPLTMKKSWTPKYPYEEMIERSGNIPRVDRDH